MTLGGLEGPLKRRLQEGMARSWNKKLRRWDTAEQERIAAERREAERKTKQEHGKAEHAKAKRENAKTFAPQGDALIDPKAYFQQFCQVSADHAKQRESRGRSGKGRYSRAELEAPSFEQFVATPAVPAAPTLSAWTPTDAQAFGAQPKACAPVSGMQLMAGYGSDSE